MMAKTCFYVIWFHIKFKTPDVEFYFICQVNLAILKLIQK